MKNNINIILIIKMTFSINGKKVTDIETSGKLFRSTQKICLNCGISAEEYNHRYCHFCFDRDNWGNANEYIEKLIKIEPDIYNINNWNEEKREKFKKNQQKIKYNSFYYKFWLTYNEIYNFFFTK